MSEYVNMCLNNTCTELLYGPIEYKHFVVCVQTYTSAVPYTIQKQRAAYSSTNIRKDIFYICTAASGTLMSYRVYGTAPV